MNFKPNINELKRANFFKKSHLLRIQLDKENKNKIIVLSNLGVALMKEMYK
ncbi:MAG: Unknown protein [uncultured Sulfurovum sp.]|uniref:Uncharacterized protein n=1 Tax=uncultured Sulfurovum sp. TaxID=269237 RepID=A0A6S6SYL0_9BACT|nr:MAG: Unknown protein [uncultured Sulfurovum sp.]